MSKLEGGWLKFDTLRVISQDTNTEGDHLLQDVEK